ncbi:DUF1361 domain-containing protein [Cellulophaga baltica]|uniref:DUF1361 domain-containing protein n=1 Tax=Cellulophaga TaxID=104264 RepID=UPI001C077E64|nr:MULTISPECIES: DUF1361 domain-containing protein [Cellulophaga]MBU2996997.1 DUF1361 domain-containing protein [Cellulophaga baltica]MDO6768395.1 DUF1361 domain-containing protein [Cellulophaga sp. 1_MG-2023]
MKHLVHSVKSNKIYLFLWYLTLIGSALLVVRVATTQTIFFTFLWWNLFLAIIPLALSKGLKHFKLIKQSVPLSILFFVLWLLFIPNSPYIVTDLKHVDNNYGIQWFDFILIFIFAANGLVLGAISIQDIYHILHKKYNKNISKFVVISTCLLGGYGIFLGRFLRFNSWDVVTKPYTLLQGIVNSLYYIEAWIWTFVFGAFMWLSYLLIAKTVLKSEKLNKK